MDQGSKCGGASPRARTKIIQALAFALCFAFSLNALAFYFPLQPEQLDEAYSLGQSSNPEELTAFLKQYRHDFPYPPDKPSMYVQSIEFQTPYEQIVSRSQMGGVLYSRAKAVEAYEANPGLVLVRVIFALRVNYSGPNPAADAYTVRVSQSKSIEPRKLTTPFSRDPNDTLPQYSLSGDCTPYPCTLELDLQFDADQFASGPVTVKGIVPSGAAQETKFNLEKLK